MDFPRRLVVALLSLLLLIGVGLPLVVRADEASDFAQKERQLSKKAGEVRTLADEIRLLDETLAARQQYLAGLKAKEAKLGLRLRSTNQRLTRLDQQRTEYRAELQRAIRQQYLDRPANAFDAIASAEGLSKLVAAQGYVSALQARAAKLGEQIAAAELEIEQERQHSLTERSELEELQERVAKETSKLAAVRKAREQLLVHTQGEEHQFRLQYEAARERLAAQGAFARSARDRVASRVWDDSGFYFNQLDSRWINERLGFSDSSTLGDFGCGVSSLAMVFKYYGIDTNPSQLNQQLREHRAFVGDLMDWRHTAAASDGKLVLANSPYPLGTATVKWDQIDAQLAAGNPVIVYIDRGATSHYVVLLEKRGSDYEMHDPIEGPYLLFGKYYAKSAVYQTISFRRP